MPLFTSQPRFATFNLERFQPAESLVQPDGKVVIIGGSPAGAIVARFDASGQLDTSFGSDGTGVIKLAEMNERVYTYSLAATASGSFVASYGDTYYELSPSGAVSNQFIVGTRSLFLADGSWYSSFKSQNNGVERDVIVRYLKSTGGASQLDPTFGDKGFVTLNASDSSSHPASMIMTKDGKLIVPEVSSVSGKITSYFEVSADGKVAKEIAPQQFLATNEVAQSLFHALGLPSRPAANFLEQTDGRIVVAEGATSDTSSLSRYNTDGSLDTSFGKSGILSVSGRVQSLAQQADGKLLVNLQTSTGVVAEGLTLARYTVNGELDKTFAGGVLQADPTTGKDYLYGVAVQADGKILVAGSAGSDMLVLRYLPDGRPDTAFGDKGVVTSNFGKAGGGFSLDARAISVHVQADGKIIVFGTEGSLGNNMPMVLRLNADGSADTSYGKPFYSMTGTGGDDAFELFGMENYINGLGGNDTLVIRGATKDWTVTKQGDDWLLVNKTTSNYTALLKNVEQINFMFSSNGRPEFVTLQNAPATPQPGLTNKIKVDADDSAVKGSAGLDIAVYAGNRSGFSLQNKAGTVTVNGLTTGTDTLTSVERVQFNDKVVAFDVDGSAGQVYRLYQAAFNRSPDSAGLGWQIGAMGKGMDLLQIAKGFMGSAEFKSLYGDNLSNGGLINQLYQNVLHRAPDAAGYDFHLKALDAGLVSREQLLVNFSESNENQANVIGAIQNGIEYSYYA